jgi:caspase domain-containing protein
VTGHDLHFAVIVGIDRYPALTDLTTARGDAEKFRRWLVHPDFGALPERNVFLVDASPADAGLDDVLPTQRQVNVAMLKAQRAMGDAIADDPKNWERTRLYVFVAGHGIVPNDGGGALVMADATPDLMGYHVDLRKYLDWYRTNGVFREVIVFADCCRMTADDVSAYGPPFRTQRSQRKTSTILGYASTVGGSAFGELSTDRGLFTDALLEALRGDAADKNGEITYESMEECVQAYLAAETATPDGPLQQADFDATGRSCVVARVPSARRTREVRLLFKTDFTGWATLIHGDGKEEPFEVESVVPKSLFPGLYKVEPIGDPTVSFRDNGGFRVFAERGSGDVEL